MNEINIIDASLSEIVEGGESRRKELRDKIVNLEKAILDIPGTTYGDQADCPLKHSFGDGIYIREIFTPAGKLIVTKIHKKAHPYFVLKGKLSVLTEEGPKLIEAPYYGITPAGTKRVCLIHEDVTWVTCHVTESKDLAQIEQEVIAKDFDELLPNLIDAVPQIEGGN